MDSTQATLFSPQKREKKRRLSGLYTPSISIPNPRRAPEPIPKDVIFDIFTKLPVHSLLRFSLAAKFCSAMINDPVFARLHQPHPRPKPGLLITCPTKFRSGQAFFAASLMGGPAAHLLTIHPRYSRYTTQSVNGIVCMDFGLRATVCNPSTRKAMALPFVCPPAAAPTTFHCVNSLGYAPLAKQYKVLNSWWSYQARKTEFRVFELGTKSWRKLDGGPRCNPQRESICIDGVIFFRTLEWADLIAFDAQNESFRVIQLPKSAPKNAEESRLINLEGRLAVFDCKVDNKNKSSVWILQDYWNELWVRQTITFTPYWRKNGLHLKYTAAGLNADTNEIILVPRIVSNPFHVYYLNRENSNMRKARIHGLPEFDACDVTSNEVIVSSYEENILSMV